MESSVLLRLRQLEYINMDVPKRLFGLKFEHVVGIATVVIALVFSVVAIAFFRKPGQMSVIESQSMNMNNLRPPTGSLPVELAPVENGAVSADLTYTGTVQSYSDEDVYPRITGKITRMPVYPGDHVRKGQLLLSIDSGQSEYSARLDIATANARAEMQNAQIASKELTEKQYQSQAAKFTQQEMQEALKEAVANLNYWSDEIKREKALLDQDVVSKQEYDGELAQFRQAKARAAEAQAKIDQAHSNAIAANAAFQAEHHHAAHQSTMAKKAAAERHLAEIEAGYTRIYASDNGVVVKRLVSPGVVVSPGLLLMRVAHIDRVRVQAAVSNSDLAKIKVGDPVTVAKSADATESIQSTISAVFPAADPATRTSIVEALIPNPGLHLLPGEYVVMRITTEHGNVLSVPRTAIVWSGTQAQVWQAVGSGKQKTAQLVNVQTGSSDDTRTEIRSGLSQGDQVIIAGQAALQPGTPVIGVKWGENGPERLPTSSEVGAFRLDGQDKWQSHQSTNGYAIAAQIKPIPPTNSSNSVVISLQDGAGAAISGATINARTSMPTMNMPGPDLTGKESSSGNYTLNTDFMSGLWQIELTITVPRKQPAQTTLMVEIP